MENQFESLMSEVEKLINESETNALKREKTIQKWEKRVEILSRDSDIDIVNLKRSTVFCKTFLHNIAIKHIQRTSKNRMPLAGAQLFCLHSPF